MSAPIPITVATHEVESSFTPVRLPDYVRSSLGSFGNQSSLGLNTPPVVPTVSRNLSVFTPRITSSQDPTFVPPITSNVSIPSVPHMSRGMYLNTSLSHFGTSTAPVTQVRPTYVPPPSTCVPFSSQATSLLLPPQTVHAAISSSVVTQPVTTQQLNTSVNVHVPFQPQTPLFAPGNVQYSHLPSIPSYVPPYIPIVRSPNKLPEVTLPEFKGAKLEWKSFKNSFLSMVHSKRDLDNTTKFNLLKKVLKGEAAACISGFEVNENNYPKAWDALLKHYDEKSKEYRSPVWEFMDIPKPTHDAASLTQFLFSIQSMIRKLDQAAEEKPSERFAGEILYRKLPKETAQMILQQYGAPGMHLSHVEDSLRYVITMLEKLQIGRIGKSKHSSDHSEAMFHTGVVENHKKIKKSRKSSPKNTSNKVMTKTSGSNHNSVSPVLQYNVPVFTVDNFSPLPTLPPFPPFYQYPPPHSLPPLTAPCQSLSQPPVPNTPASSNSTPRSRRVTRQGVGEQQCLLCGGNHHPADCQVYGDYISRHDKLASLRVCFNCLQSDHIAPYCPADRTCLKCQRKHPYVLCPLLFNNFVNSTPSNSHSDTTSTHSVTAGQRRQERLLNVTTLPTATLELVTPHVRRETRAFFDSGSQRSFIDATLAKSLNLPVLGTTSLTVRTFANDPVVIQCDVVELKVKLGRVEVNIRAVAHDRMDTVITVPGLMKVVNHFKQLGVRMADRHITSDVLDNVKIMIGADHYQRFLGNWTVRKGVNCINSSAGVLIAGQLPVWAQPQNTYRSVAIEHTLCARTAVHENFPKETCNKFPAHPVSKVEIPLENYSIPISVDNKKSCQFKSDPMIFEKLKQASDLIQAYDEMNKQFALCQKQCSKLNIAIQNFQEKLAKNYCTNLKVKPYGASLAFENKSKCLSLLSMVMQLNKPTSITPMPEEILYPYHDPGIGLKPVFEEIARYRRAKALAYPEGSLILSNL